MIVFAHHRTGRTLCIETQAPTLTMLLSKTESLTVLADYCHATTKMLSISLLTSASALLSEVQYHALTKTLLSEVFLTKRLLSKLHFHTLAKTLLTKVFLTKMLMGSMMFLAKTMHALSTFMLGSNSFADCRSLRNVHCCVLRQSHTTKDNGYRR